MKFVEGESYWENASDESGTGKSFFKPPSRLQQRFHSESESTTWLFNENLFNLDSYQEKKLHQFFFSLSFHHYRLTSNFLYAGETRGNEPNSYIQDRGEKLLLHGMNIFSQNCGKITKYRTWNLITPHSTSSRCCRALLSWLIVSFKKKSTKLNW